jgi:PST family polysaccharide transporter
MMRYMVAASSISVLSFAIGALWGIIGIAAVSAVTFVLVQTPLVLFGATRTGPVSLRSVLLAILPFVCCGVVAYSALALVLRTLELSNVAELTVGILTCYGTFVVLLFLFPSERENFKRTYALVRGAYLQRSNAAAYESTEPSKL